MNKSALIGVLSLILVALLGALGFLLLGSSRHDGSVACTEEAKLCPDGTAVGRVGPNCEFAQCSGVSKIQTLASTTAEANITWRFVSKEEGKYGTPRTNVQIIVGNKPHDLGTYDGTCFEIRGSAWELLPGEESGVMCWFAGGGTELGLFREGTINVVKLGLLDEGSAEISPVRGNFKDHFRF